jgi:hypothetical protein
LPGLTDILIREDRHSIVRIVIALRPTGFHGLRARALSLALSHPLSQVIVVETDALSD